MVFGNQELAAAMVRDQAVRKILADRAKALGVARSLSEKLLLLAGRGMPASREVGDLVPLAERAFREGLGGLSGSVTFDRGKDLPRVSFAPVQMEEAFSGMAAAVRDQFAADRVFFRSRSEELGPDNELGLDPGTWLVIRITYTGPGLDDDARERIYDPYFHSSPLDSRKGKGLEMALAFAVIRRHGGTITVDSRPEAGSVITVMLPASGPEPKGDASVRERRSTAPKGEARGTVFILEDEENVARVASSLASRIGFAATAFSCGRELVEAYKTAGKRPDVVLLDLLVPTGLGGLATLRLLQDIDPQVRAVAMSGRSDDEIMTSPGKFGFVRVLKKPFSLEELEKALNG